MLSRSGFRTLDQAYVKPGIGPLLTRLASLEQQGQFVPSAQLAAHIAEYFKQIGGYRAAGYWLGWSLQLHERQVSFGLTYWQTLLEWTFIKLLFGEAAEVESKLALHTEADLTGRPSWLLCSVHLQADYARGRLEQVRRAARELWASAERRQDLPDLANFHVRALLALGEAREATEVAGRLGCLVEGLGSAYQAKARLLVYTVQSREHPADDHSADHAAVRALRDELPFPWCLQASLLLARDLERRGDTVGARHELAAVWPLLQELGRGGLVFLLGEQAAPDMPEARVQVRSGLDLRLLGAPEIRYQGETLGLRPRFAELLAVLAAHPEGMSKAELSLAVYGERYDPSCCKTEVSRLKRLVPMESQPYRLSLPVRADFLELLSLLEVGQVDEAVELYRGPLLPYSEAPEVCRLRDIVDRSLCQAALAASSPEPLWKLANKLREDLELWEGVLMRLPRGGPRRALAQAHVHSLRRSWGL